MSPQFQEAKVRVDDSKASITRGLQSEWTMTDEWYSFRSDPRKNGAQILATLDESTYKPMSGKTDISMGDHPIAWTQCVKDGRSFYTAIGHRPESYSEPNTRKLLEQGVEVGRQTWAELLPGWTRGRDPVIRAVSVRCNS
jgi:uncharacterized protein